MSAPSIGHVDPRAEGPVRRSYRRVAGANVLLYEPERLDASLDHVIVVSMHGGLSPALESPFLERVASYGVRTAFCVPDRSSFVDQFRAMDACMALFRDIAATVVLMGQSRGAGLMSAYQKIAECGAGVFQGAERRLPLPDLHLRPADGLMLLDANFGVTVMHLMSLNPARVPGAGLRLDPELDAINPANGYAPDGQATYSNAFKSRFLDAQRERYRSLLRLAEERWAAIQEGRGEYTDNEPFIVPDGLGINNSPKLFAGDLSLLSHTKGEWPLIHADGSITTQVVASVRRDENNPSFAGTLGAGFVSTVKDYLWTELTVDEDYDYGADYLSGIDFESTLTSSTGNVAMITCPLLLVGHTAGYEFIAAEWSYYRAASVDTSIAFVEGATHGWTALDEQDYGDTLALEARYVTQWLAAPYRFPRGEPAHDLDPMAEVAEMRPLVASDDVAQSLTGRWLGDGEEATFAATGGCELSFAPELSRYSVQRNGDVHFYDRYGATTVFERALGTEPPRGRASYYLEGNAFVLGGHELARQSDPSEVSGR